MRYTIEELRAVRDLYKDPIYPDFSLEHVFEQRKAHALALRRSDNAYILRKPTDARELNARQVRREMNKLTLANFDTILEGLKSRPLLLDPGYREDMVSIIYQKALQEPESSKNYAAACRDLANFETTLTSKPGAKPKSEFRSALLLKLSNEFNETLNDFGGESNANGAAMTEEEREEQRTARMRRKRANIRFAGEVYLHDVLSPKTMGMIIRQIMSQNNGTPDQETIELCVELLTTIGERIAQDQPELLKNTLNELNSIKEKYQLRIQFMVMDLLDLQKNGWKTKSLAPSNVGQGESRSGRSPASPTRGGALRNGSAVPSGVSWRDMAKKESSGSLPPQRNSSERVKNQGDTAHSAPSMQGRLVPVSPSVTTKQTFSSLVRSMLSDWVERCDNDFIDNWVEPFNHCDRVFHSVTELAEAVATEVILQACKTTHTNAQEEAASFCSVALDLSDDEFLGGFSSSFAIAVSEALIEDCPKFPERWMSILQFANNSVTDLYFDLGGICRDAYAKMSVHCGVEPSPVMVGDEDEFQVMDTLRLFWRHLPRPQEGEVLENEAVIALIEGVKEEQPKSGLEKVLAGFLFCLANMSAIQENCAPFLKLQTSGKQLELMQRVAAELEQAMYGS